MHGVFYARTIVLDLPFLEKIEKLQSTARRDPTKGA